MTVGRRNVASPDQELPIEDRNPLLLIFSILVLALGAWALVDHLAVRAPGAPRLVSDAAYYADTARSLARGDGYVDRLVRPAQAGTMGGGPPLPSGIWAPAYPALTALAFRLSGPVATITERPVVPVLVNLAGHLVAIAALFALARRIVPRLAWLPALGLACDPRALVLATDGLTEGWSTAFLVLTAWGLVAGRRTYALAGLAFAAAVLTRASSAAFLVPYAAVLWFARSRADADGRRAARRRVTSFVLPALLLIGAWMLVRYHTTGSPTLEIQRYNLLHDLPGFPGSSAYAQLAPPDPLRHALSHPLDVLGKLATGLAKCVVLLPSSFWNLFWLATAGLGLGVLWTGSRAPEGDGGEGVERPFTLRTSLSPACVALLLGGPALIQLGIMAATLLDPRLFAPPSVPLFAAGACGVASLASRIPASRRRTAILLAVALGALLPLARLTGGLATGGPEGAYRLRGVERPEAHRGAATALVRRHVPAEAVLLTALDAVAWTADRRVVTPPASPGDLAPLHEISSFDYVLWERPGAGARTGARPDGRWTAALDALEGRGDILRVADSTVSGRTVALGRWAGGD